jgi:hypothetical protein
MLTKDDIKIDCSFEALVGRDASSKAIKIKFM